MLALKLQKALEARKEALVISFDVAGAFDRSWWGKLKKQLRAKGTRKQALALIRDYLFERFIRVAPQGKSSKLNQIFSGVPQGGKLSTSLWNFDISEMPDCLSNESDGDLVCYADGSGLLYIIDDQDHADALASS